MKRRLLILPALLLALGTALFAEDKPGSDQPVSLAHRFVANQVVRYKIVQHITGTRTFPGSDKAVPIDTQLRSVVQMQCDSIAEDGTATISFKIESVTMKVGRREANAFSAGSAPRVLQATPCGRVIFPLEEQQVGDSTTRRVLTDAGSIEPLVILAGLPEQPVASRGSWTSDVILPSLAKVRVASTLNEVRAVSTGQGAVILQTQTGFIDPAYPSRQDAQSKLIFGLDNGRLLWAEGTIHTQVTTPGRGSTTLGDTWVLDSKYMVEMLKP